MQPCIEGAQAAGLGLDLLVQRLRRMQFTGFEGGFEGFEPREQLRIRFGRGAARRGRFRCGGLRWCRCRLCGQQLREPGSGAFVLTAAQRGIGRCRERLPFGFEPGERRGAGRGVAVRGEAGGDGIEGAQAAGDRDAVGLMRGEQRREPGLRGLTAGRVIGFGRQLPEFAFERGGADHVLGFQALAGGQRVELIEQRSGAQELGLAPAHGFQPLADEPEQALVASAEAARQPGEQFGIVDAFGGREAHLGNRVLHGDDGELPLIEDAGERGQPQRRFGRLGGEMDEQRRRQARIGKHGEAHRHRRPAGEVPGEQRAQPAGGGLAHDGVVLGVQMFEQPQRIVQPVERGAAHARIAVTGQFEQCRIAVGEALQRAQALAGITMAPRRRTAEQAGEDHR